MRFFLICLVSISVLFAQEAEEHPGAEITERLGVQVPNGVLLLDEAGELTLLDRFMDQPTVISLIYFNCTGTCTPLISTLIETLNDSTLRIDSLKLATISINQWDTPEMASGKKQNYMALLARKFPKKNWGWFTGKAEDIRVLTSSIGYQYYAMAKNSFAHPAGLFFFDADQRLVRVLHGLDFSANDVRLALAETKAPEKRAFMDQFWLTILSYDRDSGHYIFDRGILIGLLLLIAFISLAIFFWQWKSKEIILRSIRIVKYDEPF